MVSAPQPVLLTGEVVEILERDGRRSARVRAITHAVLNLAVNGMVDLHLGDRLEIDGSLTVQAVERAPEVRANKPR